MGRRELTVPPAFPSSFWLPQSRSDLLKKLNTLMLANEEDLAKILTIVRHSLSSRPWPLSFSAAEPTSTSSRRRTESLSLMLVGRSVTERPLSIGEHYLTSA